MAVSSQGQVFQFVDKIARQIDTIDFWKVASTLTGSGEFQRSKGPE